MKQASTEVDNIDKPENKDEAIKILSKLEDYIDLVPEREREFDTLVERVKGLDNLASSLIIGHINTCSQVFLIPISCFELILVLHLNCFLKIIYSITL